ncbi:MAG: type II secretion system protein GspG [Myxococcota bacterium]|nr:type II secretion system protein GspG [Myxococcota bacterium]
MGQRFSRGILFVLVVGSSLMLWSCQKAEPPAAPPAEQEKVAPSEDTVAEVEPSAQPPVEAPVLDNEPRFKPADDYDGPVAAPLPPPAERVPEPEVAKAERVMRQLSSYVMAISASAGAPATLEELKPLLLEQYSIEWPTDPWKAPYVYEHKGGKLFSISSWGPDGVAGTADDLLAAP